MVEPKYPGLIETYLDLSDCYDREGLQQVREGLMSCMTGYKACYQRAYHCLTAASEICADVRATLTTQGVEDTCARRAKGILQRELRPKREEGPGFVKQRLLTAITHRGQIALWETVETLCPKVYVLEDHWGLSHSLLVHLLSGAVERGYDVVACPDPMAPQRLQHLLVPEMGLAFVTATGALPWSGQSFRRLRMDAMPDTELLRHARPRLRFYKKMAAALIDEAVTALAQAKGMHDELEGLYNPYVDFGRVDQRAQAVIREVLATP